MDYLLIAAALKAARFLSSEASIDYERAHDSGVDSAMQEIADTLEAHDPAFDRAAFERAASLAEFGGGRAFTPGLCHAWLTGKPRERG